MGIRPHSSGIYITAFEAYCDTGRYSEVARQMGVSASTAKRWVRIGGDEWRKQNADAIRQACAR